MSDACIGGFGRDFSNVENVYTEQPAVDAKRTE
jgi:hypothetical protein